MSSNHTPARLRDALLSDLISRVENGEMIQDKETGEYVKVAAQATILNAAINFLKQFPPENDAGPVTGPTSEHLERLRQQMPFGKGR